jgi:diguanylate cyclase (GGDEF)-like protein
VLHPENHDKLAKQYTTPLLNYLSGESEDALWSAYEFGRDAMAKELGPLDIVELHQEALQPIIQHAITAKEAAWIMERATKFFVESLSTFEMILRGYKEINATLRQLNDTLEHRVDERTRELKEQTAKLEYQATHDALTDLPNRTLLYDRLRQAILIGRRENKPLSLLMMDLDRFKAVNDTLGHHHGDLLLKEIGMRLWATLRESDTIARLGGDEFAVLLPSANLAGATQSARKILTMLEKPFALEGVNLHIGASIGIAIFPSHGANPESLIQRADAAMYTAEQTGNSYVVYTPEKSAS